MTEHDPEYVFEWTGEVRIPRKGDWFISQSPSARYGEPMLAEWSGGGLCTILRRRDATEERRIIRSAAALCVDVADREQGSYLEKLLDAAKCLRSLLPPEKPARLVEVRLADLQLALATPVPDLPGGIPQPQDEDHADAIHRLRAAIAAAQEKKP